MCCGNEKDVSSATRFGALAILAPEVLPERRFHSRDLSGRVTFYNREDHTSQLATHLRFVPNSFGIAAMDLDLTIL